MSKCNVRVELGTGIADVDTDNDGTDEITPQL